MKEDKVVIISCYYFLYKSESENSVSFQFCFVSFHQIRIQFCLISQKMNLILSYFMKKKLILSHLIKKKLILSHFIKKKSHSVLILVISLIMISTNYDKFKENYEDNK